MGFFAVAHFFVSDSFSAAQRHSAFLLSPSVLLMSSSTLADFEILEQLGKGSYGTVYRVRRLADQRFYVLKQISMGPLTPLQQRECVSEVSLLASLDSPHIVRYYDSFLDKDALNIIMELCEMGDVHQLLKRQSATAPPSFLSENQLWHLFLHTALGLHYLHARKILHRDLKTMNLFVNAEGNIKIGDLGVAKMLTTQSAMANTAVGTVRKQEQHIRGCRLALRSSSIQLILDCSVAFAAAAAAAAAAAFLRSRIICRRSCAKESHTMRNRTYGRWEW